MTIQFSCPSCGANYQKGDEFAGKSATCKCGASLKIPAAQPAGASAAPTPMLELDDEVAQPAAVQPGRPQPLQPQSAPPPIPPSHYAQQPAYPPQGHPQQLPQQQPGWPSGSLPSHPNPDGGSWANLRLLLLCLVGVLAVGGVAAYVYWPQPEPVTLDPGASFVLLAEPEKISLNFQQTKDLEQSLNGLKMQIKNNLLIAHANSNIPAEQWHAQIFEPSGQSIVLEAHGIFKDRIERELTESQILEVNSIWQGYASRRMDPVLDSRIARLFGWSNGLMGADGLPMDPVGQAP